MSFAEGTPTVRIRLAGVEYDLGFTLGAMRRVREQLGSLELADSPDAMLQALPAYIWACMDAEARATLSAEQVEELIHPGNMQHLSDQVGELFQASMPKGAEGKAKPAKRRAAK